MFTGIIETLAEVVATQKDGGNLIITMKSPLASELKIDQSVAHNGVCLTVTNIQGDTFQTVAVAETLQKTNLAQLIPTHYVNIERAMVFNGRIDGHLVQGHVDGVGECLSVDEQNGSWLYRFKFPEEFAALIVEKGSICLNGISLTIFDVTKQEFSVAIIPYTYEHTSMPQVVPGSLVNLEFDILGKYVARQMAVRNQ